MTKTRVQCMPLRYASFITFPGLLSILRLLRGGLRPPGIAAGDVLSPSENEDVDSVEIILMARCAERQLTEPIPIPGPRRKQDATRAKTPRSFVLPDQTTEQKVYSYGRGNGPIGCDIRVKTNHPESVCRELIPLVDTPLSPPPEVRWASFALETPIYGPSSTTSSLESVASHFNGLPLSENTPITGYSDCIVCRKTAAHIQSETMEDYLRKPVAVGETADQTEARKRAFLDGMTAGTFLLMPGGVSQAAACDGKYYSISYVH